MFTIDYFYNPYEEVETKCENVSRAMHTSKTHFNVVMEDFNIKWVVEGIMSWEWESLVMGSEVTGAKGQFHGKGGTLFFMNSLCSKAALKKMDLVKSR